MSRRLCTLARWSALFVFARSTLFLITAVVLVLRAEPTQAHAANLTVTNCTTQGLADAMNSLNGTSGGTISFNCNNVHAPASILIDQAGGFNVTAKSNYTIDGSNGGNLITVTGGNGNRLFYVFRSGVLTLANLILEKGNSLGSPGGAVYVEGQNAFGEVGTLVLDHATIQNSTSGGVAGGAIFGDLGSNVTLKNRSIVQGNTNYDYGAINSTGMVTIINSVIRNNTANNGGGALSVGAQVIIQGSSIHHNYATNNPGSGGAIYLTATGSLTIDSSQIYNNSAENGNGGGIYMEGNATITNSTFDSNQALKLSGGAIRNYKGNITMLSNSTLSGNSATNYTGGGISNEQGTVTLSNDTLTGNAAAIGGGFSNGNGTATLINVTFSSNSASIVSAGDGIHNVNSVLTHLNLTNILVANSSTGGNCDFQKAPDTSQFNLSDDYTCHFGKGRDGAAVNLGPLANNGGPTLTHMLYGKSTAVDNGTNAGCPPTDQRGQQRLVNLVCDVGAVEVQPGEGLFTIFLPLGVR